MGIWMVLGNTVSESMDPRTAAVISYLVTAPLVLAYIVVSDVSLVITARGEIRPAVAGLFTAIGFISTYVGLSTRLTMFVSTIGAMYFMVAAVIKGLADEEDSRLNEVIADPGATRHA